MADETIEREFRVPSASRVTVRNIRGAVAVQPGESGVVKVQAVKHTETGNADRTEIEILQAADGAVRVETRFQRPGFQWLSWGQACKVTYTLQVPLACSVKAEGVSASVSAQELAGELDLSTVSGPISLADLSGALKVKSVSGRISGARLSGPLRLETVSGSVDLADSNLPNVDGSTVSGRTVVQTPLAAGPYRFRTVSGPVRLLVPPDTGCVIEASGVSSKVNTSLPATFSQKTGSHMRLELQGGGPEIRFQSVSGHLWVELPPDAVPEGRDPGPKRPVAPEDRMEVLERIARGELSVDDGLNALKA